MPASCRIAARVVSALAACAVLAAAPAPAPAPAPVAGPSWAVGTDVRGIDVAGMDRSVVPGDDFYEFVNGTWLQRTEIPADRSSVSVFGILAEGVAQRNRLLLETAMKSQAKPGSEQRKIGDFYAAYLDTAAIDARGLAPVKPELDAIAAIGDRQALSRAFGAALRADVDPLNNTNFHTDRLFGLWVSPDFAGAKTNVPYMLQGGLGLPDRDYYLSDSPKMAELRGKYQAHVARVLELAGVPDAQAKAAQILALEHKIAAVHWSATDSRDVLKANNPWALSDFAAKAPGLDWNLFFAAARLQGAPKVIVWQPSAITGLSALAASEPLDVWKAWMTFHTLDRNSSVLPKPFRDERFAFYGTAMSGTTQPRDRWKDAVDATNAALPDPVGKLYVARYFSPQAKAEAEAMVKNLVAAFGRRIENLAWMSPATKAQAHEKLAALVVGVGYPDTWRDYSGLEVVAGDAFGNADRAERFVYRQSLDKIGKPVNRAEWAMAPQTVNAVELPLQNSINFPAAILQAPFFDPSVDAAVNYGGIGVVIGHEISHNFDDEGSQFDPQGGLRDWWTKEDFAHFRAAADKLAAQYDGYRPLPDLSINGKLTLSENIADVAGLSASYDAWTLSLGGRPAPALQGFDGQQRFFMSFAQVYREKSREQALRRRLLTDGHSPGRYRAATVRNVDAWYDAFDVKPGQKLYLAPDERVRIW